MLNVIITGAPGSGKGTYSAAIAERFGLLHFSTGDMLRSEIQSGTDLGRIAEGYMNQGQLIPDELIIDLVAREYDRKSDGKGVIFDGFPRTIEQAEALKRILAERGERISLAISLIVDEQELIRRLLARAKKEGRADDNEETIRKRFVVYTEHTFPLLEWFRTEGILSEFTFKGDKDKMIEEIYGRIELC